MYLNDINFKLCPISLNLREYSYCYLIRRTFTLKWLKVILAGLVEIIWVTGLNLSLIHISEPNADSIFSWLFTLIFIILSFYLVINATKSLPVGTVYAIFVGIGAAGTVIVDILFFNQPFTFMKILLVTLLIIGIIGLKLSTTDDVEGGSK